MNLWNFKFDWVLTGNTWFKDYRLNDYDTDDKKIDNISDLYFKFEKCISGITYHYVIDLYDIYKRNIMIGNNDYNLLYYNEYDTIDEYLDNFNSVDFYINNNIDLSEKLIKINDKYLKSNHRIILTNQDDLSENDIYTFDNNGLLTKTDDLSTTGKTFRYGVNIKLDNNENVEFFLMNSGNTFPLSNKDKLFTTGHTFIIKNSFYYNINNTGTTYEEIPKIWFTDYNFARKLNEENYSLYTGRTISKYPVSTMKIQYRMYPEITFSVGSFSTYDDTFDWTQETGNTVLIVNSSYANECDIGDYLNINLSGSTGATFNSIVHDSNGSDRITLNEYIPDYIFYGVSSIQITNLNKISTSDWEQSYNLMNNHYIGRFISFTGDTSSYIRVDPIYDSFSKYIDYDSFKITVDTTTFDPLFTTDNHYINYKLYEHLNDINSSIFDNTFDFGSGFTITSFTQEETYLLDDDSYPASISTKYSPLKITPDDPSYLNYFKEYTIVYVDYDYNNRVYILDKDDTSFTIEKPNFSGEISGITSNYSLTGISETLYELYINSGITGNTYYPKDDYIKNKIFKSYNDIISNNDSIKEYTTGTITPYKNNNYILKLFNYRNNQNTELTGNTIGDIYYGNDRNLSFKPIEIVDIGIDKITKMPIYIKDDEIIITDNASGYTVDIVKENIKNHITLVDGLTIEKLKIKYIWIFNATVKDAIIGEDDFGLVWYTGEWVCGEWINGTWYSGIFRDGIWRNGRWYSNLIDKYAILVNQKLKKLDDNKKYSIFENGNWLNGEWYNGTFGYDITITGYTSKSFLNHTDILPSNLHVATWSNGKFNKGEFKNSIWENGIFLNGDMYGGYWKNGSFFNGTFQGNWWNGNFQGGDFISGIWENGNFYNTSTKSRFGYNTLSSSGTSTEWWNGTMNNAELFAGITNPINHNRTHWYNGTFRNSKWHGGHFFTGLFNKSKFYNGVFGTYDVDVLSYNSNIILDDSDFINGLWLDGTFRSGNFYNGIWLNGNFLNGNLRTIEPDREEKEQLPKTQTTKNLDEKRSIL